MTHRRSSEGSQIQAFFQEPPYNGAMMVPRMPGSSPAPHRTLSAMRAPMTTAPLSVQSPWLPEPDVIENHVCAPPSQPPETVCTAAAASTTAARALRCALLVGLTLTTVAGCVCMPTEAICQNTAGQEDAALAASYGVRPAVLARVPAANRQELAAVAPQMRAMYRGLTTEQKRRIRDDLGKSTRIAFITISHRNAFVRGSVAGVNIFDKADRRAEDALRRGEITPDQSRQVHQATSMFRQMTPVQRQALAELMLADTPTQEVR